MVQAACKLGKCARLEEAEASIGVYRCLRSVCWEALLSPPTLPVQSWVLLVINEATLHLLSVYLWLM